MTQIISSTSLDQEEINLENSFQVKELNSVLFFSCPQNKAQLEHRLNLILGRRLDELAYLAQVPIPDSNKGKGFVGQIVEIYLGAHAGNLPLPDFVDLNIELKTIPVNQNLIPEESTYICMADINPQRFVSFENSALYHKLKNILFVLVLAPKNTSIEQKRVIGYFFYTPSKEEMEIFKSDYNELNELICNGKINDINASLGNLLQIRPKASNGKSLILVRDHDNNLIYTRPRGYYLRRRFTTSLCQQFLLNSNLKQVVS